MSFTNPTTASTSVVLVPTATSNPPYYVYLNNVSTAGRIVTVRDNDGFASLTNQIVVAPINGAYFMDGTSSITINQPYGYLTFNTAINGGYGILNTFGFPAGSAAAFVSNVTSCNLTTSTLGAQFISAPTAVFNTVAINTISTGTIIINTFTPSTIAANSISTGSINGGSVSFQTIFGSSITTNSLSLASLTTGTGNFTNVITSNATTTNFAFTGDVAISGAGAGFNVQIGSNTAVGSRGVAIGGNTKAAADAVSLGFAAGSNNQGAMATSVGGFAGETNQGVNTVAVGYSAGSNAQGANATSVGYLAGAIAQGVSAVALGDNAGYQNQANAAIAIGAGTGQFSQGIGAISIGGGAGQNSQANGAIAIGAGAGQFSQGASSIAIGVIAGQTSQHANTTIINASGSTLNSATTNALYIAPIRDDQSGVGSRVAVYYNQITKEMTTGPATGTNLTVSSIITSSIVTNGLTTTQLIAATLQTNTISTSLITGTGISSLSISTGTTLTGTLQTSTLSSGIASFGLGNVSTINTNSISTASLNVGSLNVNSLSTGSILLATASISSLATNAISSGTITANSGTISTFTAESIVANTERVGSLSTNFISANTVNITGPTSMINARTRNVFVVNGNDSAIDLKYSLDGITWCNSITNGGFSGNGSKVAWNGSLFVAVGGDTVSTNTIKYSSDGSNWFNSSPGGFTTGGDSVAWNGRMWVATGDDATSQGRIKYSFNGSNWSNANTTTFSSSARGVAWGNGRWVVAGIDAGGAANSIMTSSDGSNWSFATNTTGNVAFGGQAYNGSYWLIGATGVNSNAILYSSNAINWNRVESTAFTNACLQVGWNGSYWVALGEGGATIQTSQNGMVWTPATSGLFGNFGQTIVWNGSFWLAGGYDISNPNATVKYSRDGLNWTNTVFGVIPYVGSANGLAYTNQLGADITTQEMNIYSQNIPNVLQSTNQIVALTSSLVLNNTLYVNQPANYVGINASIPQAPLHVVGGMNGQTSQIMLQTLGSTLNTSVYVSTNVGQATLGVVGPSNGFMTGTVPGDTALTTARTTNRLVMGNGTQIGLFISSGTVVVPGTLSIGGSISTASISTSAASFNNITVASSTLVSTLFFTGDVSIQASTDEIRIGSNAGISGQGRGAVALGAAAGQTTQGIAAVAIGSNAGQTTQGIAAVAFGVGAGQTTQGVRSIAFGSNAGSNAQGADAIAIGSAAGGGSQGANSIAIGALAGQTNQHANTIIINASGSAVDSATTNALYVAPIRDDQGITGARTLAYYNATTKEITTGPTTNLVLSTLTVAGAVAFPAVSTNSISTTNIQANQISSFLIYGSTIGVGTTTPQFRLDVNGTMRATQALISSVLTNNVSTGQITANQINANALFVSSATVETTLLAKKSVVTPFLNAGLATIDGPTSNFYVLQVNSNAAAGTLSNNSLKYSLNGTTYFANGAGGFIYSETSPLWVEELQLWIAGGNPRSNQNNFSSNQVRQMVQWSQDGINWNNSITGAFSNGAGLNQLPYQFSWTNQNIVWMSGKYPAVNNGYYQNAFYSSDGKNWLKGSNVSETTDIFFGNGGGNSYGYGNAYCPGCDVVVAVGYKGSGLQTRSNLYYSADKGSNWFFPVASASLTNPVGSGYSNYPYSIAASPTRFVAMMSNTVTANAAFITSTDGSNWSTLVTNYAGTQAFGQQRIFYAGGLWFVLDAQGTNRIHYSQNLLNWTVVSQAGYTPIAITSPWNIDFDGYRWIVTGANGYVYTSADLVNWAGTVQGYSGELAAAVATKYKGTLMNNFRAYGTGYVSTVLAQSVGIGTTNPQANLDVAGSAYISSGLTLAGGVGYGSIKIRGGPLSVGDTGSAAMFFGDPGRTDFTGWLVGEDTNYARVSTFAIGRVLGGTVQPQTGLYIMSNGNVGISGISSPATNLVVNNPGGNTGLTGLAVRFSDVNTIIGNIGDAQGSIQTTRLGGGNSIGTTPWNLCLQPLGCNVGIGTNGPVYALEVNGQVWARSTLYVGSNTSNNQIRFYGTSGDGSGSFNHTVIAERIYTPAELSELVLFKGNDSADRVRVLAGSFQVDVGGLGGGWNQGGDPPTATYPNALVVDTNGSVGIGNIAPSASFKLDVNGAIRANSGITVANGAVGSISLNSGSTGDQRGYINFFNSAGSRQGYIGWEGDPTTYIRMHSENGGIGYQVTSNFKVDYRIGVGLGSASPQVSLDVAGRGRILQQGSSNNTTGQFGTSYDTFCINSSCNQYQGGIASLFFGNNTPTYPLGRIYCQDAQPSSGGTYFSRMVFMVNTANQQLTEAMRIDSNARVGINFTAPTQLLTVGGSAGKTDGPSWSTASDERIKTDITSADINRCYSDIYRLNLRRYTYTSSYMSTVQLDDKYSLGFIAQEVSTIMPKMVSAGAAYGFDDFQWVNYGQLSFAHYGATQKLMHIAEKQSTMIQTLTSQVAELQQTVSTLVGRATV